LYGPYAHRTGGGAIQVTLQWMRPGYDFPRHPWYREGIEANGKLVFTDPYFDLDHVYISAVRAFRRSDGQIAGVVTVDTLLTNLETVMRGTASDGSFSYVTAPDGRVVATSDDTGLVSFARARQPNVHDASNLPRSTLLAFAGKIAGDNAERLSTIVPTTRWRVGVAVARHTIEPDGRHLLDITLIAIGGIWLAAIVAVLALLRSGKYARRTRALEAQRRTLELEIAERVRAEERLREYAYRDELTQLANRASVIAQLTSHMEQLRLDADDNFAVLFIDLDRFNIINDSLGHATGDALLAEIAHRLRDLTKAGDLLARLGGDEFVLVMSHATEEKARSRAAEIIRALRHPLWLSGHEFFISASIGIALGDPRYEAPEELLRDADAAMYEAKRSGRSTFRLFDRSMHARAMEQLALETDLRRGISRGEIFVEYQPIFSLSQGRLAGFEALARWRHPTRGRINAETFVPLAEQTGLIVDIDERVMAEACATARSWVDSSPDIFVAVNASAAHLTRIDDLSLVRRALEASGLPPSSLKLEITETAIMEGGEKALGVLARLRDLGVGIVIDDFGTGYSSLSYLQRLPIEELKIDRTFIGAMVHNEKAAEIVRAILAISKALHLRVTAEGVETNEQANRLAVFGVGLAQGYYYGKAMDAAAASELLRANSERSLGVQ
jgi:diguanylate cyclase (GGDEF)-like protein